MAVSADALQVYQGLEILTGAATAAERAELEHRLISFLPVDAQFSAGQYAELAHSEIDGLLAERRRPIVVGGTGLYLRAALANLSLKPPPLDGVRERWTEALDRDGPEALHAVLAARAPWAAAEIAPGDSHRIIRALELHEAGELEPPQRRLRAVDADHSPSDAACRVWSPTASASMRRSMHASTRCSRRESRTRCGGQRRWPGQRDSPQGAWLRGSAGGDVEGDEAPYAQLRAPSADLDAQAPGCVPGRCHRPRRRRRGRRDRRPLAGYDDRLRSGAPRPII